VCARAPTPSEVSMTYQMLSSTDGKEHSNGFIRAKSRWNWPGSSLHLLALLLVLSSTLAEGQPLPKARFTHFSECFAWVKTDLFVVCF